MINEQAVDNDSQELRSARSVPVARENQRLNLQRLMQSSNPDAIVRKSAERVDGQTRYSPCLKETAASACTTSSATRVRPLVGTGVVTGAVSPR